MFDFGSAAIGVVAGVVGLYLLAEVVHGVATKRRRTRQDKAYTQMQLDNLRYANDWMFTRLSDLDSRISSVELDLGELEETVEDLEDEVDENDTRATSQDETDLLWECLDHQDARLVTAEARIKLMERVQDEKLGELDTVLAAHINSGVEVPGPEFIGGYTDEGVPFLVIVSGEEQIDE